LVDGALSGNPSVEEAFYRVRAARALARADDALRFPQATPRAGIEVTSRIAGSAAGLNEAGEAEGQGARRTVGVGQAGIDTTWEIDLFGRLASQVRAAERGAEASIEELEAIRTTLAADVVRTYVELRGAQRRRAVVMADIAARRQLLELVESQKAAGLAGEFDFQRASATFEAARARLPVAEIAIDSTLQRLATLVGQPKANTDLRRVGSTIPALPLPGATLPADLLRTRPDVRRAEKAILQRAALADVAYAELFPRLTLGGTIEVRGNVLAMPIAGTPVTISGGPGVSIPLFDWGQRRASLDAREAELEEAIAAYRRTVLGAVEDVEVALASVSQGARRVDRLRTASEAARRALSTAQQLYREGAIGLTERLQAETDLRQAEFDLAEASEAYAISVVTLHRSLGAGPRRLPALRSPTAEPPAPVSIIARGGS
jgi:NodT family efflux transporter outer membrane factor (OMF) lipoprotein